jgi:hypothetical protein
MTDEKETVAADEPVDDGMTDEERKEAAAVGKEAARQDALATKAITAAEFRRRVAEMRAVHANDADEARIVDGTAK